MRISGYLASNGIVDAQVSAGVDDGDCIPVTGFDPDGTYVKIGNHGGLCKAWYRFPNIIIPLGAIITAAYISLHGYGPAQGGSPLTKVFADNQADPGTPESEADLNSRDRTTNGIDWDGLLTNNEWNNSPSIVNIIQELVDSYDYSGGSAILILHDDDGSPYGSRMGARTLEDASLEPLHSYAPKLHIEYTTEAIITHLLTILAATGGATAPAPGVWEYEDGDLVTVSAIPDAGWLFDHWEGAIAGSENPAKFTITADMAITAVFSEIIVPPEEHAVTISIIGEGTTDPLHGAYTVAVGAILTITAYPAKGWVFNHWEGDVSGKMNPVNVEVLTDISIVAVFTEKPAPPPLWPFVIGGAGLALLAVIIHKIRKRR